MLSASGTIYVTRPRNYTPDALKWPVNESDKVEVIGLLNNATFHAQIAEIFTHNWVVKAVSPIFKAANTQFRPTSPFS
jgi:hypothetical protein